MMRLSHESKLRLGVGIGAFVLIIGLVFGISRALIHFDGPWDLDDVVSGLSGMDDAVDEDDLLDGGNYSARPQRCQGYGCLQGRDAEHRIRRGLDAQGFPVWK